MESKSLLKCGMTFGWAVLFSLWATPVLAGGYRVIIQAGNDVRQLDRSSVRQIFSGEKIYWETGGRIVPIHGDLHSDGMGSFFKDVMHLETQQFLSNWRRKLFTGRGTPPHSLTSDDQVLEAVEKTKGAIGVVSGDLRLQGTVKILQITD